MIRLAITPATMTASAAQAQVSALGPRMVDRFYGIDRMEPAMSIHRATLLACACLIGLVAVVQCSIARAPTWCATSPSATARRAAASGS